MISRCTLLFLTFLVSFNSYSQREIKVSYEYDEVREKYVFEAHNLGNSHLTLVVYFKTLENLRASTSLPAIKTVGPGVNQLFTLERSGPGSINFNWGWVYWHGTHNAKIVDAQYVLPTTPNIKVGIIETNTVKAAIGQEDDSDFYGLGFKLVDGDTICAIRKGVVELVEQETQTDTLTFTYTRNRNRLTIRHDDGTIARYSNFRNGSAFIEAGDEVNPGTPLAIATQTNTNGDATVLISINHLNIDPDKGKEYKDWSSYLYVRPKFVTEEHEGLLEPGKSYTSILNEELVTQEMSKREKKKYLAGKN